MSFCLSTVSRNLNNILILRQAQDERYNKVQDAQDYEVKMIGVRESLKKFPLPIAGEG